MNEFINVSRVGRIEDMPYYTSPPLQFTYTQQAALALGTYPFVIAKTAVANNAQLTENTLIYLRDISFYADIPALDYQAALKLAAGGVDIPRLSLYMEGNAAVPLLRTPIELGNYFREQSFRMLIPSHVTPNNLLASVQGTLQQHAGLAGIAEVNITVELYCQEIVDDDFIKAIKRKYPALQEGRGVQL